jgi:hypothetical protein
MPHDEVVIVVVVAGTAAASVVVRVCDEVLPVREGVASLPRVVVSVVAAAA